MESLTGFSLLRHWNNRCVGLACSSGVLVKILKLWKYEKLKNEEFLRDSGLSQMLNITCEENQGVFLSFFLMSIYCWRGLSWNLLQMFGETVDITAAELLYRFSSDNLVICYIFTTLGSNSLKSHWTTQQLQQTQSAMAEDRNIPIKSRLTLEICQLKANIRDTRLQAPAQPRLIRELARWHAASHCSQPRATALCD